MSNVEVELNRHRSPASAHRPATTSHTTQN